MRLPFVSRAAFEMALASRDSLSSALERADTRHEKQADYLRALVQQIVDLKKEGFRAPKPVSLPKESATAREIEEIARMGAREEFIQRAAASLMEEQQLSASDARDTAEGLADAMYAQNVEGA